MQVRNNIVDPDSCKSNSRKLIAYGFDQSNRINSLVSLPDKAKWHLNRLIAIAIQK